jgi:hypothetical protein
LSKVHRPPEGMFRPFGVFVSGAAVGGELPLLAVPEKLKPSDRGKAHLPRTGLVWTR